jgi:hypothetical protein
MPHREHIVFPFERAIGEVCFGEVMAAWGKRYTERNAEIFLKFW